jgi:glycerol-3-phosphate dehydrogenase
VPRRAIVDELERNPRMTLDDVRRVLRLGMGPCQGGFCTYRAAALLHAQGGVDAADADELLVRFLHHRWLGIEPILYGDQVRQAVLDEWIFQGLLDVEHLPGVEGMAVDRA